MHAALSLIGAHGLGTVTMSGIADAAGVARQTLYSRYTDIDSIVATAIRRHNRESIELLAAATRVAEFPRDKLEQMCRHFASIGASSHHSLELRGALPKDLQAGLDAYQDAVDENLLAIVQQGQADGLFRSDLVLEIDIPLVRWLLEGVRDLAARTPDRASRIAAEGTRTIVAALA